MKKVFAGLCILAVGLPAMGADVKPLGWYEKLTIKGDFRYRHEYIDKEGDDVRHRERIRARIAAEAKVNSDLLVVLGLSSGNSDPVSSNQTLTDEGTRKPIMLELAYADWTLPVQDYLPGQANVLGGKMKNPFLTVGDLVWDGDYNPEGGALKYKLPAADSFELLANGGAIWLMERSKDDDTLLYAGQLGAKLKHEKTAYLMAGGSYYFYNKMQGYPVLDFESKMNGYGNSTTDVKDKDGKVTGKNYKDEYQLIEGLVELGVKCPLTELPWKFYGNVVKNNEASDNDLGYMAGLKFGEAREVNQFSLEYNWRYLEADAVVGALTDSDSGGGGTNHKGHKLQAVYVIAKNWSLGGTWFIDKLGIKDNDTEKDYQRVQVDLMAKF